MPAARTTLLRLAAGVMALFGLALAGADLVEIALAARAGTPPQTVIRVTLSVAAWGVGLSVLALAVVWRVTDRAEALVAALVFGSLAAIFSGVQFDPVEPLSLSERIPRVMLGGFTYSIAVRFAQLFPRPLQPASVLSLGRRPATRALLRVPAALLSPALFWPSMALMELVVHVFQSGPSLVAHVLVYTGLASLYLYAAYRTGSDEDRRRLFWLFEGALILFTLEVLETLAYATRGLGLHSLTLAPLSAWLWVVEGWVALTCFSLAVLYSGALDSRLVLRKTAILSASGVMAVVLFVAIEEAVSGVVVNVLGLGSNAGALIAGVLAALAFRPLTDRVDHVLRERRSPDPEEASPL